MLVGHSLAVFSQAALAGSFLSGSDAAVKFHELNGWVILAICAAQIVIAAVLMRSRVSSLWLVLGSVLLFLAEGLQFGSGYGRFLDVHVPLGVLIFGAVTWQTISMFLKRSPSGDFKK